MRTATVLTPDFSLPSRFARLRSARVVAADGRRPSPAVAPVRPVAAVEDLVLEADAALIADLLTEMERVPWREPTIRVVVGLDRAARVAVAVGPRAGQLTPEAARLAAATLIAEQAFAGCGAVAARLRDAALRAEGARSLHRDAGHSSAARTLAALAVLGAALALVAALHHALTAGAF